MSGQPTQRSLLPDLWVGGAAVVIGLGAGAYERQEHAGIIIGSITYVLLCYVYALPAGLFGWSDGWCINVVTSTIDLFDFISVVFTIFS
jgi:hypothetical protein